MRKLHKTTGKGAHRSRAGRARVTAQRSHRQASWVADLSTACPARYRLARPRSEETSRPASLVCCARGTREESRRTWGRQPKRLQWGPEGRERKPNQGGADRAQGARMKATPCSGAGLNSLLWGQEGKDPPSSPITL